MAFIRFLISLGAAVGIGISVVGLALATILWWPALLISVGLVWLLANPWVKALRLPPPVVVKKYPVEWWTPPAQAPAIRKPSSLDDPSWIK